jgi:hypothetical protein
VRLHCTFDPDETFEVTQADIASLAPLGFNQDDPPPEVMNEQLKAALQQLPQLPVGFWDAYLDEGEWEHDPKIDCEAGEFCCMADHMICTRPGDEDHDDVFVRIPMSHWTQSIQVFARNREEHRADVTIDGEPYSPQDCVTDLAALLAVFRFFVARGDV